MKPYSRFENVRQMSVALGVFVVVALLLESGAIYNWADRLELGPERTIALPLATGLSRGLRWTRLDRLRNLALVGLARVRWSDDPDALENAETKTAETPSPSSTPIPEPVSANPSTNASNTATNAKPTTPAPLTPPRTLESAPALLTPLPAIAPVPVGKTRTIALAGDSMMAVGLSSTILRDASQFPDLAFVKAFKSGTGLARPEVFNWQQEYPAMIKQAKPDFVIVAIGANDGQGFVQNGVTYQFGTPGWQQVYEQRVAAYLDMLEANGATVVWLELPPMKSEVYDARIALVNRIDATMVAASPHAIWVSIAGIVGDANGRFRDIGSVNGKMVKLRQGDGIHLSDEGAVPLADKLLPWLAAQAPAPAAPAVTNATPEAKP